MSAWLGYAWLLFLCMMVAWGIAALLSAALAAQTASPSLPPASRSRRAVLIALLPWLATAAAAGAVLAVSAAKPLGLIEDHCLLHGPGHPHLCLLHLPVTGPGKLQALLTAIVLALPLLLVLRHVRRERRSAAGLRSMRSLSHGFGRLSVLDSDRALALAANPRNPFILLSSGMLRQLTRRQRRIVVAHEIAHLRNHDLVRNQLFELLLLPHFPRAARELRTAWRQSLEECADDAVAARFGSDAVAQTLIRAMRGAQPVAQAALNISGANPVRRIERLLENSEMRGGGMRAFETLYAVTLIAFLAIPSLSHHSVETLLGLLAAR